MRRGVTTLKDGLITQAAIVRRHIVLQLLRIASKIVFVAMSWASIVTVSKGDEQWWVLLVANCFLHAIINYKQPFSFSSVVGNCFRLIAILCSFL